MCKPCLCLKSVNSVRWSFSVEITEGIKRISSYGVIGGKEVYGIYEVDNPAAMTRYVSMYGAIGFDTEVLPLVDTEAEIKAVLEGAQWIELDTKRPLITNINNYIISYSYGIVDIVTKKRGKSDEIT